MSDDFCPKILVFPELTAVSVVIKLFLQLIKYLSDVYIVLQNVKNMNPDVIFYFNFSFFFFWCDLMYIYVVKGHFVSRNQTFFSSYSYDLTF